MAGCLIGNPSDPYCFPPDSDSEPTPDEQANEAAVNDFLRRVWSYRWTDQDQKSAAQPGYLPQPVSQAIDELVHPGFVRHRGKRATRSAQQPGPSGGNNLAAFRECVRTIHNTTGNIAVGAVTTLAKGDQVIALLSIEGTDARPDGSVQGPGLLGLNQTSGQAYRAVGVVVYRLSQNHKIQEDWAFLDESGLLQQLQAASQSA